MSFIEVKQKKIMLKKENKMLSKQFITTEPTKYMLVCIFLLVCVRVCMCVCVCRYIYVCVYMLVYIYMCMYVGIYSTHMKL